MKSIFTSQTVSGIGYVVFLLFPVPSAWGKGEDTLSQPHVSLPDKNLQE